MSPLLYDSHKYLAVIIFKYVIYGTLYNKLGKTATTYRFLNLSLVRFDLLLEFLNHVLHALLCLTILVGLKGELLEASVGFTVALLCLTMSALLVVVLHLQRSHTLLELLDDFLATFEGAGLGLVQACLQFLHLVLEDSTHLLDVPGVLLLLAELLGHTGGVTHRLLGVLFGHLQFGGLVIQITLERDQYTMVKSMPGEEIVRLQFDFNDLVIVQCKE